MTLIGEDWAEQLNPHGHGFIVQGGSVFQCLFCSNESSHAVRCCQTFGSSWYLGLRGQYNLIQGDSDEAKRAWSKFLLNWDGSPMMVKSSSMSK